MSRRVAVIGGGPAGLMAADTLRRAGLHVDLYEAMGSVGRKLLIAGKGGLNLTHAEPFGCFVQRYGAAAPWVGSWLQEFGPDDLRQWARHFGIDTFVGSSGRVFPLDLKAAPLLRGWVRRLREHGVRFHVHHRWLGWDPERQLRFQTVDGERLERSDAVVLALGGGSWPELGTDGAWVPVLRDEGVDVRSLQPSNCGFEVDWSPLFAERHAGAPVKPVRIRFEGIEGNQHDTQGEFLVTRYGIEGSLVYALSALLREVIAQHGQATIRLDLAPGRNLDALTRALSQPRGSRSVSDHLRRRAALDGVRRGLLHELMPRPLSSDPGELAGAIKSLPLILRRTRPLAEAISSAGGVAADDLDHGLMLRNRPGVFCAGEMLDWEAPTGGYLLSACFASGRVAARAAIEWLESA